MAPGMVFPGAWTADYDLPTEAIASIEASPSVTYVSIFPWKCTSYTGWFDPFLNTSTTSALP